MALYLKSKKIDLGAGKDLFIVVHQSDADDLGINEGEIVLLGYKDVELYVKVIITDSEVAIGEVGLYEEIPEEYHIPEGMKVMIDIPNAGKSLEAIKKKISGQRLNEEEILAIMEDIGSRKLKETEVAFFVSTFFNPGFNDDEIKWMTKGMAESGEILEFKYIKKNKELVVDKHSIGGTAGKGITPILVPILAANGLVVPNSSTRAITSPAGTTDILETVLPVALTKKKVYEVVEKTGACMIWGGSLYLAPADDEIINVERSLKIQEFQKVLVSIVAKKIAMGVTSVLIDLPYGRGTKLERPDDLEFLVREFEKLFAQFGIKCVTYKRIVRGPDGNGVGPILEMRDCLRVLERDEKRPLGMEEIVLGMAAEIFEHNGRAKKGEGKKVALELLDSGKALAKFWEIAKAQGAKSIVKAQDLKPGKLVHEVLSPKSGELKYICTREIVEIARSLGTPKIKEAGIYLHKLPGQKVEKGELLMTLYATTPDRMEDGVKAINLKELYEF
ncbi:MAG: thymidine phosphorylase [Candidatus Dojkabacteria bacterium]|jgi:AMP phosphorylase|nr:thymidine phosphorylase [Candidatus Dojkabacteria bacterium]